MAILIISVCVVGFSFANVSYINRIIILTLGLSSNTSSTSNLSAFNVKMRMQEVASSYNKLVAIGVVMTHKTNELYSYAPSLMFDESDNKFKLWSCYGFAGNVIRYQEATSIEGLASYHPTCCDATDPPAASLSPTRDLAGGEGDSFLTCDPNVYVAMDANGNPTNDYYMAYGGLNYYSKLTGNYAGAVQDLSNPLRVTEGLMAHSGNKGFSFSRLHNGVSIITPDTEYSVDNYGVGQPAVIYYQGNYFMIYTNQSNVNPDLHHFVLRQSGSPAFGAGWANIRTYLADEIGGWSLDFAIHHETGRPVIVANLSTVSVGIIGLIHLNPEDNWSIEKFEIINIPVGSPVPGEGIAILKNRKGVIQLYNERMVFISATYNGLNPYHKIRHISGAMHYYMFSK